MARSFNKKASDRHYVAMGRWSTLVGVLISVATAYLVQHAASIMDYVQQLFQLFYRAAVRHSNPGHVVETRYERGRLLGIAGRHRHFNQPLAMGKA